MRVYCVYCGVKLQEGAGECPLCHTPVMLPDRKESEMRTLYPDRLPEEERHGRALLVWLLTMVMIGVSMACLILCLHRRHEVGWSGYVMMSLALAWVWVLLPLLFPRFRPMIFLPIDFACLAAFLLYICVKNGENWFLSFAFPVTGITAVLTLLWTLAGSFQSDWVEAPISPCRIEETVSLGAAEGLAVVWGRGVTITAWGVVCTVCTVLSPCCSVLAASCSSS